jgi:hypothetical protein
MQTLMTDFLSARTVQSAKDGMHLLILHGYMDSTVVVECSEACLENIHAALGQRIEKIKRAEEAAIRMEDEKDAWIAKHLYGGDAP